MLVVPIAKGMPAGMLAAMVAVDNLQGMLNRGGL